MLQDELNHLELDQQVENELTKLRLAARYGTVLTADQSLPTHLEAVWLKQVEAVDPSPAHKKPPYSRTSVIPNFHPSPGFLTESWSRNSSA